MGFRCKIRNLFPPSSDEEDENYSAGPSSDETHIICLHNGYSIQICISIQQIINRCALYYELSEGEASATQ